MDLHLQTFFLNGKITNIRRNIRRDYVHASLSTASGIFFIYSWVFLAALWKSPYLWGCKTNEWRSEVSGGEGRACLLARSSLASHPLASCQLRCPSPSLSPLRWTGCQCRGGQHAPQNKHTHCQFLLSLYLSICRPSASQVWKTGKQMDQSGVAGRALPADEAQTSTVQ